jgi:hypothetical protein
VWLGVFLPLEIHSLDQAEKKPPINGMPMVPQKQVANPQKPKARRETQDTSDPKRYATMPLPRLQFGETVQG